MYFLDQYIHVIHSMSPFGLRRGKWRIGSFEEDDRSNKESNDEINIRADVGGKEEVVSRFSWIVLLTSLKLFRDVLRQYKEHVLANSRQNKINILDHEVSNVIM